jgi:hypothetical protein
MCFLGFGSGGDGVDAAAAGRVSALVVSDALAMPVKSPFLGDAGAFSRGSPSSSAAALTVTTFLGAAFVTDGAFPDALFSLSSSGKKNRVYSHVCGIQVLFLRK